MMNEELHPLTLAREAHHLSQAQLAEEVHLGRRTVWQQNIIAPLAPIVVANSAATSKKLRRN